MIQNNILNNVYAFFWLPREQEIVSQVFKFWQLKLLEWCYELSHVKQNSAIKYSNNMTSDYFPFYILNTTLFKLQRLYC